jgi:hypothetical protein
MSTQWLDSLQEKIAACWEWHSPAVQIGFRYIKPEEIDDFWEIWAYPAIQEIVGGKEDGEKVWSGFNFDIMEFLTDFKPEVVSISTRRFRDPSELTLEGQFHGQGVFLHLCLEPPEDTEATEIVDIRGDGGPFVRDKE